MSGGWFKVDAASWPAIAEVMPEVWPEEAVRTDIRWWHDQEAMGRERMPGARTLANRWGWTHWKARQILKAETPHSRRTPAAQSPHTGRTPTEGETPEIGEIPHTDRTPAAQSPHENRHTRVGFRQQTTDSLSLSPREGGQDQGTPDEGATRAPEQQEGTAPEPTPTAVDQVVDLWLQLQQGMEQPEPTSSEVLQLESLLGELGLDQVIELVRWWWSPHSHATWLRAQGYGWSTWLQPHLARRYLKMNRTSAPPAKKRAGRGARRRAVERLPEREAPTEAEAVAAAEKAMKESLQQLMRALTECEDPETALLWADVVGRSANLADLDLDTLELAVPLWRMMAEEMAALDWPEPRIRRVTEQGDAWEQALQEARRRRLRLVRGGGE